MIEMHDPEYISKGVYFFRREGSRIFSVIPSTTAVLGLVNPKEYVEKHGLNPELVKSFIDNICYCLGYKKHLVMNFEARFEHPTTSRKREATFLVSSMTEENREYKVTIGNLALPDDPFETKLRSFRNLEYFCTCGRGTETDVICSMPYEACKYWGVSKREWEESFNHPNKFYTRMMCKHIMRSLQHTGVYPFLNKKSLLPVFPTLAKKLNEVVNREGKITQREMDILFKPYLRMFLPLIKIFRMEERLDKALKDMEKFMFRI